jgi:hypothetical protein
MAEEETWETLAKRLTGLVVKLDERNDKLDERNERLDTWIAEQRVTNTHLARAVAGIETTLADLRILMREVFRERTNGHTD